MKNKEYMSLKKMIEYINKAIRYTDVLEIILNEENSEIL